MGMGVFLLAFKLLLYVFMSFLLTNTHKRPRGMRRNKKGETGLSFVTFLF